MAPPARSGRQRAPGILLGGAALWNVGLLVMAALAHLDEVETVSASSSAGRQTADVVHRISETLVQADGVKVLAVMAVPLAGVVAIALILASRSRHRRRGAGPIAWTLVGLLAAFCILGILTVGAFVLPVAVACSVACAMAESPVPEVAS